VGPLAIFFLIYTLNPGIIIKEDSCNEPFDFSIFLEDSLGNSVLKNEGSLILQIENEKKSELIDNRGSATFKQISFKLRDNTVNLQLDVDGWQFTNDKKITGVKLEGNNQKLIVERDNSLCCVSGSVQDEEHNFLSDVRISIGDEFTFSNNYGRFFIEIPKEKQSETQILVAIKMGYHKWEDNVFPSLKREVSILLIKK
jgi:hypothetical protein